MELETDITFSFLVSWNSKNRCNGTFSFVKWDLERMDAIFLAEICPYSMTESSSTNLTVLSLSLKIMWMRWKYFWTYSTQYLHTSNYRTTTFSYLSSKILHVSIQIVFLAMVHVWIWVLLQFIRLLKLFLIQCLVVIEPYLWPEQPLQYESCMNFPISVPYFNWLLYCFS